MMSGDNPLNPPVLSGPLAHVLLVHELDRDGDLQLLLKIQQRGGARVIAAFAFYETQRAVLLDQHEIHLPLFLRVNSKKVDTFLEVG